MDLKSEYLHSTFMHSNGLRSVLQIFLANFSETMIGGKNITSIIKYEILRGRVYFEREYL